MRFRRRRSARGWFPTVAARRAWSEDGTPIWEFRFTPRAVDDPAPGPAPTIQARREPVRFVSSRGVELGRDTLRIDQYHQRVRKPAISFAEESERAEGSAALVALAADPDNETAQHRVVAQLALTHPWFRGLSVLDISAARITGVGLGQSLDGVFIWRAEAGRDDVTYLVVPHPDTKDLLAADPDLLRALLRAACPDPDAPLGELEGYLREAITRLGVTDPSRTPRRPAGPTSATGLVLAVNPDLDAAIQRNPSPDRPKSDSERALSEELAELARKVGSASVRPPRRPSKAG